MKIVSTTAEVRAAVGSARAAGRTIGFVPTMGALHRGHGSLIAAAKQANDFVVVSIFVNPLQFNDANDLAAYPTTTHADEELCRELGADVILRPTVAEVYPVGFDTRVEPGDLATNFEGAHRPGHFTGMATVVLKLLNMVFADDAYFGRKDFQQLAIVRRMVEDLNHPTRIHGIDTVREDDGLAMSSRNLKLTPRDRTSAARISEALRLVQSATQQGVNVCNAVESARLFLAEDPAIEIEYLTAADAQSLRPVDSAAIEVTNDIVILVAARIGGIRLIDNVELNPERLTG